jgi:peroxiredoxin
MWARFLLNSFSGTPPEVLPMSSLALRALAFAGLSLMISACGGASSLTGRPGELGKPAPSLAIQSLNGKGAVSLSSLSGKVTVVQFWATWCEPCKKSLSQLEQLKQQSGGAVEVIGISVDDTTRGVADFAKTQGVSFPIAWDENHTLMWRWSVEKMPATFIVDSKGNVRFVHETKKDKDDGDLIAREVAELTSDGVVSSPKVEVASASVPAAAPPVAVTAAATDAAPAATTEETSATEVAPTPKPKAKPGSGKKGVSKKPATKKNAAAAAK